MKYLINVKRRFFTGFCAVLMFIVMYFGFAGYAQAGTLAYIQASVDLSNWEILTAVVRENVGLTAHSPEVRRVNSSTLQSLANNSGSLNNSLSALSGLSSYVSAYDNTDTEYEGIKVNGNFIGGMLGSGEKYRVLTFPAKGGKSETRDFNKATEVNDALVYDLNQAFSLWLDAKGYSKTPNLSDFYNRMIEFLNSINISGDECTVPDVDGIFTWRIAKGYTGVEHDNNLGRIDEDADYVNWGMLVYEAFNNFLLEGEEAVTEQTVYSATPGQFEKTIVGFLGSLLDGLRGILGLWSVDELIFNADGRSYGYVGGIFPKGWESVVWTLFVITEVLAAMILMYGVINNILRKATSTLNTFARLRAMQQVQDIIVCAVALALLPLLLRIVISMSSDFVDMIYSIIPVDNMTGEPKEIAKLVSRYSTGGGTIGGCVAQFLYFGIQVYFNFFYMLRSLMVALLIIIAPIMVSMIMVSDAKKQMTVLWGKELLANILIQPIHAFIIATILLLPNSSHGFDNMIAIYAMIPLTAALRSMFFGGSGGLMDQAASSAKSRFTGGVSKAALLGGGAAVGFGVSKVASVLKDKKDGGKDGGEAPSSSNSHVAAAPNNLGKEKMGTGGSAFSSNNSSDVNNIVDNNMSGNMASEIGMGNTADESGASSGDDTGGNSEGRRLVFGGNLGLPSVPSMDAIRQGVSNFASSKTGQTAKGIITGAAVGALGVGLATIGGAVEGAGVSTGRNISGLGSRIISHSLQSPKAKDSDSEGSNSGGSNAPNSPSSKERQAAASSKINPGVPPNLAAMAMTAGAIELGRNNSGFRNMGDVSMQAGKGKEKVSVTKRRYYADNEALANMGISNITDNNKEMSFTADTTKSPEMAELGAYADYCQYLEKNGRGDERDKLQESTGISATRTDDSDNVQVIVNKGNWRQQRNGGEAKYQQDGANIKVNKDYNTQDITGMYIEGKKGQDLSLIGGIRENSTSQDDKTSRVASFSTVMKNPKNYDPKQYTVEPNKHTENVTHPDKKEHTYGYTGNNENRTPEIVNHNSYEIPHESGFETNPNNLNTETHNNPPENNLPESIDDIMDFGDNDYIPDN